MLIFYILISFLIWIARLVPKVVFARYWVDKNIIMTHKSWHTMHVNFKMLSRINKQDLCELFPPQNNGLGQGVIE